MGGAKYCKVKVATLEQNTLLEKQVIVKGSPLICCLLPLICCLLRTNCKSKFAQSASLATCITL